MELELQADLIEALEGIDPSEFLINDPELTAIANDITHHCSDIIFKESLVTDASLAKCKAKKRYSKIDNKSKICVVCSAPAKGFHYYGAVTCSSCRAFFKRSFQGDSYKGFLCKQGGLNCQIDIKIGHRCRLCRFNFCLRQGMVIPGTKVPSEESPITVSKGIKSGGGQGRKSLQTFLKDCMENNFSTRFTGLIRPLPLAIMTEMLNLKKILQINLTVENKVLKTFLKDDLTYLYQMAEFAFLGKTNPIYMNKGVEDFIMLCGSESLMNSASELNDNLAQKDRARLAKSNTPLILEYLAANRIGTVFDPAVAETKQYVNLLKSKPDKKMAHKMYKIHLEVFKKGTGNPIPITYGSIYDKGLSMPKTSKAESDWHKKIVMRMALGRNSKGLHPEWDPVISALTTFIIYYTPDFLDLDNPSEVTKVQSMFAGVLQRYLRSKEYASKEQIFIDSMLASSYARELRNFKIKAYQRMMVSTQK